MRIISLKNVALTSVFLLSIGFNYQVNAGTILHKFQIQLPNGEIQNMSGGPSIHSVVRDNNDIAQLDYCNYDRNDDDSESSNRLKAYPEYQCYTPSGCDWSTWHAPYFPSSFDSTRKEYSLNESLKDGSGEKDENMGSMNASYANFDPQSRSFTQAFPWAKQYFNTTDPLGGQYFYWEGRVDQICPPDPEADGDGGCINRGPQAFKILSGVQKPSQTPGLDYDLRKSGENAVADVQNQIDPLWTNVLWRKLHGDGTISGGEGNNNRQAGYDRKPVTYNTKPGEKSILYNAVGGNAIHGNVTWVLKNSIPQPKNPKCEAFDLYKEDNSVLANQSGVSNVSSNQKFYVSYTVSDPDGPMAGKDMQVCWTVAGQPADFYRASVDSLFCENFKATAANGNSGKVNTPARTYQGFLDKLLGSGGNVEGFNVSEANKAIIRSQVEEKGLVFVTRFVDNSRGLACSGNLAYGNGSGLLVGEGISEAITDPGKCATTPAGKICKAIVKVQETPTVTPVPPRCGDGVVDAGEQCDDGNTNNNDSCTNECKTPTVVQARCGDNLCNRQGETCDGTAACTGAGQNASFVCRAVGTAAECTYCGDGVVNGGEQCDDGNSNNGDSCSNSCLKPNVCDAQCTAAIGCGGGLTCTNGVCTGAICEEPPRCGDNKCDSGESCDANIKCIGGGELSSGECRTNSTVECTFCGDGIVQTTAGEQCDDGNTNNGDGCDNNCRVPELPRCGDGVCDSGEKCEGTISCLTNQPMSSGQVCRLDCTYCGDRVVQAGEQCDEGGETATCTSSCIAKTVTPPPTVIPTSTAVPTLVPTDLEADDIWIYTLALGMIGLGLVAYRLNLGYKFAGIVMENGGLSLVLKLRHAKRKMQNKGLLRKSKKDFEKDFMDEEE